MEGQRRLRVAMMIASKLVASWKLLLQRSDRRFEPSLGSGSEPVAAAANSLIDL